MNMITPQPDEFFYAHCTVVNYLQEGPTWSGGGKVYVRPDRSYRGGIFKCVLVDDSFVLADQVYGGFSKERVMLPRSDFRFEIVQQPMLQALSLLPAEETQE